MLAGLLLLACQSGGAAPAADGAQASPEVTPVMAPATTTPMPASATPGLSPQGTATPARSGSAAQGALFLSISEPAPESVVTARRLVIAGCAAPGAFVSVDDDVVSLDAAGCFRTTVLLEEGPNSLDVVASDRSGRQAAAVVNVIYVPQRGT